MKKFNIIAKYPMIAVTLVATTVFVLGPVILSLLIGCIIVLPMYLAVRLFGDKD